MHLRRELEQVDQHNPTGAWPAFAQLRRRLVRDGSRRRKRPDCTPDKDRSRSLRLGRRRDALSALEAADADARRLRKRRRRTGEQLGTGRD